MGEQYSQPDRRSHWKVGVEEVEGKGRTCVVSGGGRDSLRDMEKVWTDDPALFPPVSEKRLATGAGAGRGEGTEQRRLEEGEPTRETRSHGRQAPGRGSERLRVTRCSVGSRADADPSHAN